MHRLFGQTLSALLGLMLIGFWIGSYWYWRADRSVKILSHRTVFVPDWVPKGAEKLYEPLASIDSWLNEGTVSINRWDVAFPKDRLQEAAQGIKAAVQEIGEAVEKGLTPQEK